MKRKFKIQLKNAHEEKGLTVYAIAKQLKLSQTTVRKYIDQAVLSSYLPTVVIDLANFYGVDWRDPSIVDVVDVAE